MRRRAQPRVASGPRGEPFVSAEAAWFWALPAWLARREGARVVAGLAAVPRPCEPVDVVNVMLRLAREQRIGEAHLRVLVEHGVIGMAPSPVRHRERAAARLWQAALARAEPRLRGKGIVA